VKSRRTHCRQRGSLYVYILVALLFGASLSRSDSATRTAECEGLQQRYATAKIVFGCRSSEKCVREFVEFCCCWCILLFQLLMQVSTCRAGVIFFSPCVLDNCLAVRMQMQQNLTRGRHSLQDKPRLVHKTMHFVLKTI